MYQRKPLKIWARIIKPIEVKKWPRNRKREAQIKTEGRKGVILGKAIESAAMWRKLTPLQ